MSHDDGIDWAAAARAFDSLLVPTMFAPWSAEVVARAAITPGDHVIDLGCGTGPAAMLAAVAAGPSGRVVALDGQPAMLAVGKAKPSSGAPIDWVVGDAMALTYPAASFDVAVACHLLQHLPDPAKALAEVRRVLKPGGRFVTTCWRHFDLCPAYGALIRGMAAESRIEPEKVHAAAGYRLGDADKLKALLAGAGLRDIELVTLEKPTPFASADGFLAAVSQGGPFTRKSLESYDDDARGRIFQGVRDALARYAVNGRVEVPFAAHILSARV
ncbi:MAG: methyltransferase domain-containing protein [Rhodospirillaceae bacterium]|nr:methyltransferase domain-containing protein [Rhodospirillaceae bacterium]